MQLQMIVFYATWLFFTLIISIGIANYYYYGDLSLNLNIVTLIVKSYPFITLFTILILSLVVIYQYKLYKERLNNRKNCQITFVDLEKIAHLWLEYEEIEDNIEHKVLEKMEVSFDESKKDIQEVINTLIGNRMIENMTFYKKYVFNYLDSFSKYELEIIAILYELLETRAKELPSVATLYKSDTDKTIYKDIVSEQLTSYEILYKVNLFDHTMHVVECMYEVLIKEKDAFVFSWSRMLISSLAHDIGKIEKIESLQGLRGLDSGKYENNTHENISRLILSNAFPNYEYIDEVCEIIEKHHIQVVDEHNKNFKMIKYLKTADQMARKLEIKEFLNNKKENVLVNKASNMIDKEESVEIEKTKNDDTEQNKVDDIKIEEVVIEETKVEENILINPKQETVFNPSDIGNLIELIIKNINEIDISTRTNRERILSISYKNELFIPNDIFKTNSKKVGLDISIEKDYKALVNKLRSDGVLKYETSNITIVGFPNSAYKSRKEYLVFDLDCLGISVDDADLKKRNNEILRNTSINKITKGDK